MKQKILFLFKWVINIIAAVNLLLLVSKLPFYQKQMHEFEGLQNSCRNVDWTYEKQILCIDQITRESSLYVDGVRYNTTYGIFMPLIFYGALLLYRDYATALKENEDFI